MTNLEKLFWLTLILTCSVPSGMFVAFNYKELGLTKISDDAFLTLAGSIGAVFNGLGRFCWGLSFDRFSYRQLSSTLNLILLLCCILFIWAVENNYSFLIVVAITYACYGGNYSIYPTETIRVFGNKNGAKLYFIVFTGYSLGS